MTQEQKDLLIKDLCGRLSHGVKCKILELNEVQILGSIQYDGENTLFDFWEDDQKIQYGYQWYLNEFKPCLFPISSMTEEQLFEVSKILGKDVVIFSNYLLTINNYKKLFSYQELDTLFNWFDKNHFDYRGLIPMGLAEDATGKNIY